MFTQTMTKGYKDNVNAYKPTNWGQKYCTNMSGKLSQNIQKMSPWGLYPQQDDLWLQVSYQLFGEGKSIYHNPNCA